MCSNTGENIRNNVSGGNHAETSVSIVESIELINRVRRKVKREIDLDGILCKQVLEIKYEVEKAEKEIRDNEERLKTRKEELDRHLEKHRIYQAEIKKVERAATTVFLAIVCLMGLASLTTVLGSSIIPFIPASIASTELAYILLVLGIASFTVIISFSILCRHIKDKYRVKELEKELRELENAIDAKKRERELLLRKLSYRDYNLCICQFELRRLVSTLERIYNLVRRGVKKIESIQEAYKFIHILYSRLESIDKKQICRFNIDYSVEVEVSSSTYEVLNSLSNTITSSSREKLGEDLLLDDVYIAVTIGEKRYRIDELRDYIEKIIELIEAKLGVEKEVE